MRWHVLAKHQSDLPLLRGLGNLGIDLKHSRLNDRALQIGLRLLCPAQHRSGQGNQDKHSSLKENLQARHRENSKLVHRLLG